jgi:hypothetical protein
MMQHAELQQKKKKNKKKKKEKKHEVAVGDAIELPKVHAREHML